ncbi:unnamed protein product, partial [marine sediment metagenome]
MVNISVRTGIPGLDELMDGGFPKGDLILVSGKVGTGTSTLAIFLFILAADATGEATLSVVVPPDASENDSMTVTVSATSTAYPSVTDSDTCETIAKG